MWVDEFGVVRANERWHTELSSPALYANEIQRECLLAAGDDVEAGLTAAEIILSTQPQQETIPQHINAFFAYDIHNRKAQGILNSAIIATKKLTAQARKELSSALKQRGGGAILEWLDKYRVAIARILTGTQLAAVLEGAREVADKMPPLGSVPTEGLRVAEQERIREATTGKPPTVSLKKPTAGQPEELHFPIIEEAVKSLANKRVLTRPEYDRLEAAARAKAFTVANIEAKETLEHIRDSLSRNIREGADYETWRDKVVEDVDAGTFLSDSHQEVVFRTNVQTAFSDGQMSVLQHPLVRSGFPYSSYDSIHDDRVRVEHQELDKHGIDGSNIYRNDDPVFQLFRPPWDYNCRCSWTPLTVQHASELGVKEAKRWLETGVEPYPPAHVEMPPFQPPEGFQRSLSGAPLSIQLSLQSMFSTGITEKDEETDPSELFGQPSADESGGSPATTHLGKHGKKKKVSRSKKRRLQRQRLKARLNATMAVDDDHDEKLQLMSEILALLYDDKTEAEKQAKELIENGDIFLAVSNPNVKTRYGKQPGPGWVAAGFTRKGVQRWHWMSSGRDLAPTPLPPAPSPSPPPVAAAPPPPAPSPPPVPTGKYAASHQTRAANATIAYNNAMAMLAAGTALSPTDKTDLAKHLSVMTKGQLNALHTALGGTAAIVGSQRQPWVHAIKGILAGATPAAPPSTPPAAPSVLHKGANVITGAPAAAVPVAAPSPPVPNYYQPPPPRLTPVMDYIDIHPGSRGGKSSNSTTMKTAIDHTDVSSFGNDPSNLSADFSAASNAGRAISFIAQYDHTPSGYKIIASKKGTGWLNPGTTSGDYTIDVLDGTGKIVSTYSTPGYVDRDENYIKGRLVQVAQWAEGEIKRLAALKNAPTTPHLAQFAWDYAQAAGLKPGTVPFSVSDKDFGDTANRAKMDAYLKTEFPKLIGARQHRPHGGMDTIEHTMNILNPANLRTAGLPARDAELLRLGMLYHDVGKQYDPLDHEHPRKSAKDAEPLLWQHGLSPQEVSDTLAVVKWHDAYGDAMQAGSGATDVAKVAKIAFEYAHGTDRISRTKEAHRINDLLMRAWQSDVSSIPGLTADPVPGRPDVTVTGFLHVDTAGAAFKAKVAAEIDSMAKNASVSPIPNARPLPKAPPKPLVGTDPRPDYVAKGKKWGELVQRTDKLLVGQPVPHGSTKEPPKEVYDEARKNPDLNYARAFNMGYDGPTGDVIDVYHGISSNFSVVGPGILSTGIRAGNNGDNVFGHGIYTVVNGADNVPTTYGYDGTVQLELHTGRTIDHVELQSKVVPAWRKANPKDAKKLQYSSVEGELTAAALWAGYSSIAVSYGGVSPTLVVIDPARIRVKQVVKSRSDRYKGRTVNAVQGNIKSNTLTSDEINTPSSNVNYVKLKHNVPQAWNGIARTS